jgi:hypothetical protein
MVLLEQFIISGVRQSGNRCPKKMGGKDERRDDANKHTTAAWMQVMIASSLHRYRKKDHAFQSFKLQASILSAGGVYVSTLDRAMST